MEWKISRKKKEASTTDAPAEAAAFLTDDLILEILSRLPARSVHRFKCVSPSWRDLIADPVNRKKLPHTLAGFLYSTYDRVGPRFNYFRFADFSIGAALPVDMSLPFLPPNKYLHVLDTCNGLLLCLCSMAPSSPSTDEKAPVELHAHFVVCNPATRRWVALPPGSLAPDEPLTLARLAFDPAVSSHFHVLQFKGARWGGCITGVSIYSSKSGAWIRRESLLVEKILLKCGATSVFFHGMLHLLGWLCPLNVNDDFVLVAVDMEGKVWKTNRVPSDGLACGRIGLSQGCLHYFSMPRIKKKKENTKVASVWFMEDYDSKEWVLKNSVSNDELRNINGVDYKVAAFHPDCDTIFLEAHWTLPRTLRKRELHALGCPCDVDALASYDTLLHTRRLWTISAR
ncbi:hypothetical protein CFC21_101231 [Triticum aestivum]|uniref:F-box domain-containing protein n=2 Tax=Triticum aestivum TaxID=4565 RepID=A0A9R1N3T5_WHEAT|nr:F-box protein At5g07610-like [Triticum dicoccoides]XP_044434563.1 F-box protein At5g07610-like [Triticum aestivum]KAF7099610.1 hypothetical protein CFC21_101231 [Triticum aestivum]